MTDAVQNGINDFGRLWLGKQKNTDTTEPDIKPEQLDIPRQKFPLRVFIKILNFIKL